MAYTPKYETKNRPNVTPEQLASAKAAIANSIPALRETYERISKINAFLPLHEAHRRRLETISHMLVVSDDADIIPTEQYSAWLDEHLVALSCANTLIAQTTGFFDHTNWTDLDNKTGDVFCQCHDAMKVIAESP